MQVIICDDEFSTCVQLENYIEKYSQEHFIKADIDVFYDGESLCEYLKSSSSVDLLFLDIELPKCNGVEVGKYIREKLENEETEIIYISSKTNYAMKLFQSILLSKFSTCLVICDIAECFVNLLRKMLFHDLITTLTSHKETVGRLFICYHKIIRKTLQVFIFKCVI